MWFLHGHGFDSKMKNTNLETPPYLIKEALQRFDIKDTTNWMDFAATKKNRKFNYYFNKRQDFLKMKYCPENGFCNPPFDRLAEFVSHCYLLHLKHNTTIMMLLPCYTDSKWWTEYIGDKMQCVDDYYFLHRRLGFYKNGKEITSNKYYMPCVFILWGKKC